MGKTIKISQTNVSPTQFVDYKMFLHALYQYMKSNAPQYSFKQMAIDLGFAPTGIVNQMINGRRKLTVKTAATMCIALELSGTEKRYFLTLVEYTHAKDSTHRQELHSKLVDLKGKDLPEDEDKDALEYFSRWYHPVIREILGMDDASGDPEWLAERIFPRIRVQDVEASIALMVRLRLLIFDDSKKRVVPSSKTVRTPRAVRSIGMKHYHEETIELGKAALAAIPGKERNISTITTAMSEETFETVKNKIIDFQLALLAECEASTANGNRVFQFNTQLFPVSKVVKKKG